MMRRLVGLLGLVLFIVGIFIPQGQTYAVNNYAALFHAINNIPSGGVITLTGDIVIDGVIDLNPIIGQPRVTAFPDITKALTIDGNSYSIIRQPDADQFRFFMIELAGELTLKNVALVGGELRDAFYYTSKGGGAICNKGTVTLDNVTFKDNYATFGAALYNPAEYGNTDPAYPDYSSRAIIIDSIFEDHYLHDATVLANSGELIISNSIFRRNRVSSYIGRVLSNNGVMTITDTVFSDNTGITISNSHDATVINSVFRDNQEDYYGILNASGSFETYDAHLTLKGIEYINSSRIYNNMGQVIIQDSLFAENDIHSGDAGVLLNEGDMTIEDSIFHQNRVRNGSGGAILNSAFMGNMIIRRSTFSENWAQGVGAISNSGRIEISDSLFVGNENGAFYQRSFRVPNNTVGFVEKTSALIENTTFLNNPNRYGMGTILNNIGHELGKNHFEGTNLTIIDNVSTDGFLFMTDNAYSVINNSIFYSNIPQICDQPIIGENNVTNQVNHSCGDVMSWVSMSASHLGDLADNGGKTQTVALINTGDNLAINPLRNTSHATTHDQRGVEAVLTRDIGAYESAVTTTDEPVGIIISPPVVVNDKSETQVSFTVALTSQPIEEIQVDIIAPKNVTQVMSTSRTTLSIPRLSKPAVISQQPANTLENAVITLTFTPDNWNIPQEVIISNVGGFVINNEYIADVTIAVSGVASSYNRFVDIVPIAKGVVISPISITFPPPLTPQPTLIPPTLTPAPFVPDAPAQPEDLGVVELPATGERPLWADLLGRLLGR